MAYFSRGKNKIQQPYTYSHMYQEYLKEYKDDKLYSSIEYPVFVELCNEFYKGIMDSILVKNTLYKMPHRMGSIRVIKRKVKPDHGIAVDWVNSVKYKKKIVHLNEHSNGYKYLFKWFKNVAIFTNQGHYRLVFTRANKRRMASLIKSGVDYYEE